MRAISVTLAAAIIAASAGAAPAATITFSGSRTNVDSPGPAAPRCGSRNTANIRPSANSTSVGTSNLGAFTPILSHCIQLPLGASTPFDLGEFSFDFGGGHVLLGTYSGVVTFASPGVFNINQTHIVTGGLGKFLNATGSFDSAGQLTFPGGRPTVTQMFSGVLQAPGIPEPASWAMMIGGFALAGAAIRRRVSAPGLA
ncbi:MAG TPA: PEPxxWA-CTERM sorting domain-containing protein [Sphingomonas sp.]|jgi:hypothetical protein|nr:PEPxxWA-CTERM sorting domain-containing protein [Sphingomonas sp.]